MLWSPRIEEGPKEAAVRAETRPEARANEGLKNGVDPKMVRIHTREGSSAIITGSKAP